MLNLTSVMILIPYLFVASYAVKITKRGESYKKKPQEQNRDFIVAAIAVIYTIFMIMASGMKLLMLSALLYAPGTLLYIWARRENNKKIFSLSEWIIFIIIIVGAVIGLIGLFIGYITI